MSEQLSGPIYEEVKTTASKYFSDAERSKLDREDFAGWQLEAWAVFSNHYHFVAHSAANQPTAESLGSMLKTLHVKTSGWVNRLDKAPARQVWFNFRETRLTYPRSYFARLNYTHQNP